MVRRPEFRVFLALLLVVILISAFAFIQGRISVANARGRVTLDALMTVAVIQVCSTFEAEGESPPICNPK